MTATEAYKQGVQELSPGSYAYATGRQVWIQNAQHRCISRAYRLSLRAEMFAWRNAFEGLERAEQAKIRAAR